MGIPGPNGRQRAGSRPRERQERAESSRFAFSCDPLLQQLRRQVRPVHRDVAGRAVAVARQRQVVERRRLRAERLRRRRSSSGRRGRAGRHVAHWSMLRVVGAVRLVAGEAVAGRSRDVVEDEGPALLGVAVQAGQLALARQLDGLAPCGRAGRGSRGTSSRRGRAGGRRACRGRTPRLRSVAGRAEGPGRLGEQVLASSRRPWIEWQERQLTAAVLA